MWPPVTRQGDRPRRSDGLQGALNLPLCVAAVPSAFLSQTGHSGGRRQGWFVLEPGAGPGTWKALSGSAGWVEVRRLSTGAVASPLDRGSPGLCRPARQECGLMPTPWLVSKLGEGTVTRAPASLRHDIITAEDWK